MIPVIDAFNLIIPILQRAGVSRLEAIAIEVALQRIKQAVDAYTEPDPT